MDKVKFLRHCVEGDYHYHTDNTNMFLANLAHFLLTEVDCFSAAEWIESINEIKDDGSMSGNMISVERRGHNLYLSYLYDNPESPSDELEISKEELLKLIAIWDSLMKEKPEEIILIRNNSKFDLISRSVSKRITNENAEC